MKNLLLIGAGQLGSRYLQSIIKENFNYNIIVVDTSEISLRLAKKKWEENNGFQSNHKISWQKSLPEKINNYDLAIVATSSKNRASLVYQVASKVKIKYWILEKILAQSIGELETIKNATANAKSVFVNTPKRQMKWYINIQSKFPDKPVEIIKKGGLWGLACNAIHYLDLVSYWTNESLTTIDTKELSKDWFPSKRKGYYELTGKIKAKFSKGTELILQSLKNEEENILQLKFLNNDSCNIYEKKGIAIFSNGERIEGHQELQSDMSGPIITKILNHGTSKLPTLSNSSQLHAIFLKSMLEHWNKSFNKKDILVPIT